MKNNMDKPENQILKINSSRLKVEIAQPGKVYSGSRFDWTGFITQVTLDNSHTFCVPERYEPGRGTGGIGFCNEFGIDIPIGYKEANVGDCFTKIGVGLLKRNSEEPYEFLKDYEINKFPVEVSTDDSSAKFSMEPIEYQGFAVRLQKTISVTDNILNIDYRLENTGSKPIVTSEYCHNFIGIDGHDLGKDYCLSFPYEIKVNKIRDGFVLDNGKIRWESAPQNDFYALFEKCTDNEPYQWQLLHEPSGVGVRELSKLHVSKFAMWGCDHVVSPELFIDINLGPNEVMEWSRKYEFFA